VLLPSLVAEMAPLTIMEADRLKVPAIVSDVPGSAELVNQYDCGIVFKYNSADELYNKIVEIESGKHVFGFSPAENNFYATARRYHEIYQLSIEQLQSGNKSDVRNSPGN
jgi:glycosyltransferase involved in cell wall biosynthesis